MKDSLKNINYRLYFSLLFLGLCPAVYSTLRIFFLGQMPGDWSYSIAGQLSWVNLIYEVLNEAIILPLFFFMGKVVKDKEKFTNRIKSGLTVTFVIYMFISAIIIIFAKDLLNLMAADKNILAESAVYIRIESIANIFVMLSSFVMTALITLNRAKYIYILTLVRLGLNVLFDTLFISELPMSFSLGVNGIGYSNIVVNLIILFLSVKLLSNEDIHVLTKSRMSFTWMKDFLKIGGLSGLESFVRNIAYMIMIVRMVNVVNEQGTYWVANGFIWGWLLLPVLQLGELIKQEISTDNANIKRNTKGYFGITGFICILWIATIPLWKPFMKNVLGYGETDKLFSLVLILLGFYVLFAFQNVFDATFYALGKTNYMLLESVVTNTIYYGGAYLMYREGLWTPSLNGIALLFGIGIAFDSVVSFVVYVYMMKKGDIGKNKLQKG